MVHSTLFLLINATSMQQAVVAPTRLPLVNLGADKSHARALQCTYSGRSEHGGIVQPRDSFALMRDAEATLARRKLLGVNNHHS